MDLIERIIYFSIGGILGFVLGYIVKGVRVLNEKVYDVKEELQDVNKNLLKNRGEEGIMSHRWSANLALFVVVLVTLYAALMSQEASNKSNETSDRIATLQVEQKQNLDCTTQILFDAISALNERTTYAGAQLDANLDLVESQLNFLKNLAAEPPLGEEAARENYLNYVKKVTKFIRLSARTQEKQDQNPYPTVSDLASCLAQTPAETKEPEK